MLQQFLQHFTAAFEKSLDAPTRRSLSQDAYSGVVTGLSECYLFLERLAPQQLSEHYAEFLYAAVKSAVAYATLLAPPVVRLNRCQSFLTVPLSVLISAQDKRAIVEATAQPFKELPWLTTLLRGTSFDSQPHITFDDAKDDKEFRKDMRKIDDDFFKSVGADIYHMYRALDQTPFGQSSGTPFFAVFNLPTPYPFDNEARFQHTWVISPTGTGKTTLLEHLINLDIPKVLKNEASIIVLDGENQLIPRIMSAVSPETDKIVLLEPDINNPLALNIFDNQAIDYFKSVELADFVLSALLGADLTAKQSGIFRYLAAAMQVIPNATIETLRDLLKPHGYERYREIIVAGLDDYTADFFETRFNHTSFNATKDEIFWRLDTIMSDPLFRAIFKHPRNKLDLSKELDASKIILVNTAPLTGKTRTLFGRFIIAMLNQATESRVSRGTPSSVFAYVDECQDYIADEPLIAKMLDKLRKQKVAMTFAHQRLSQITNPDVKDALANARVKFAGRMTTDASFVGKALRIEPEILTGLPAAPPYRFAYTSGEPAFTFELPKSPFSAPIANRAIYLERMHERYCAPPLGGTVIDGEYTVVGDVKVTALVKPRRRKPADDIDLSPVKEK